MNPFTEEFADPAWDGAEATDFLNFWWMWIDHELYGSELTFANLIEFHDEHF